MSKNYIKIICDALEEKKAENIKVLHIGDMSTIADYFIIANGTNKSQTDAMADHVEEVLKKEKLELKYIEGIRNSEWILMDYGEIIVHILSKEGRSFYNLEHIWGDCQEIDPSSQSSE